MESNVNLVSNFYASIRILQEAPLSVYQFPVLNPFTTTHNGGLS